MSLKNPFGLTLELSAAEAHATALAVGDVQDVLCERSPSPPPLPPLPPPPPPPPDSALCAFLSSESSGPIRKIPAESPLTGFDFPDVDDFDDHEQHSSMLHDQDSAPIRSNVQMRFRDSAIIRSEQLAAARAAQAAAAADAAAAHRREVEVEEMEMEMEMEREEDDHDEDDEDDASFVRLNYFVHNGFRYDGDIFELRPPQERSIASRPERYLEHKPAVLNHRQVFNRVYSEGTYNNRPSSLRKMRNSARFSTASSNCDALSECGDIRTSMRMPGDEDFSDAEASVDTNTPISSPVRTAVPQSPVSPTERQSPVKLPVLTQQDAENVDPSATVNPTGSGQGLSLFGNGCMPPTAKRRPGSPPAPRRVVAKCPPPPMIARAHATVLEEVSRPQSRTQISENRRAKSYGSAPTHFRMLQQHQQRQQHAHQQPVHAVKRRPFWKMLMS